MSDLETLRSRLALQLSDASADLWPAAALDECLRLALAGYNRAAGASCSLGGLDGALVTTLPAADWDLLLNGAAGLAASVQALARASQFSPDSGVAGTLLAWAKLQLERFEAGLGQVRLRGLQASPASPHSPWEWEE